MRERVVDRLSERVCALDLRASGETCRVADAVEIVSSSCFLHRWGLPHMIRHRVARSCRNTAPRTRTQSRRFATAATPSIVAPNKLRSELKSGRTVTGCMVTEVALPAHIT